VYLSVDEVLTSVVASTAAGGAFFMVAPPIHLVTRDNYTYFSFGHFA